MQFRCRCLERLAFITLSTFIVIGVGCAPPLDAKNEVSITRVTTGWLDAGLDNLGRSKLVPTIEFNLRNISDKQIEIQTRLAIQKRRFEFIADWVWIRVSPSSHNIFQIP